VLALAGVATLATRIAIAPATADVETGAGHFRRGRALPEGPGGLVPEARRSALYRLYPLALGRRNAA